MVEYFDNVGRAYLEQLLRAAIQGEVAHNEPEAGRIVAALMTALVKQEGGARVDHYLRRTVDQPSVYHVTCFDKDDRPISRVEHLDAGQAIRMAAGLAAARPDATAAVTAPDDEGHQRCVMLAEGSRISFRFPEGGVFDHDSLEAREESAHIEEIARSVDAQLDGSLAVLDGEDIAVVLRSMIPSAAEIADLVVKRLSDAPKPGDRAIGAEPAGRERGAAVTPTFRYRPGQAGLGTPERDHLLPGNPPQANKPRLPSRAVDDG